MKNYRIIPMSIFGIGILALDQITKFLVVKYMDYGESIPIIQNFLSITSHRNSGAAWGMLQGNMWLFYIITVFVIIMLLYFYKKEATDDLLLQISLTMLIAGALGNFIDRVLFQEVVDMIDTMIFSYDFPIFNVADSSLTIGVILMLFQFFTERGEQSGN